MADITLIQIPLRGKKSMESEEVYKGNRLRENYRIYKKQYDTTSEVKYESGDIKVSG